MMTKKNVTLEETKKVVKTGMVGMVGMTALGAMAPIAGPAAGPVVGLTGAAVGLSTLGQAVQSGGKILKDTMPKKKGKQDDLMKKIWG